MALVDWDDTLRIDIEEIDDEHKRLIELLNAIDQAMREGRGRQLVDQIIDRLIEYAKTHFLTEERYFEQYGYPDAEAHKYEHAFFIVKVFKFKREFDQGKLMLSVEILDFLMEWLRRHIKGSDQRYSEFFRRQGRT